MYANSFEVKARLSPSKKLFISYNESTLKDDEKCF